MTWWGRVALATTALAVTLGSPGVAAAAEPACGSTITEDTTLARDLVGCPGTGLVIAAGGVTLDLGGHTISGSGQGSGISFVAPDVTVRNGRILSFDSGVAAIDFPGGDGQNATVEDVTISRNQRGFAVSYYRSFKIRRALVSDNAANGLELNEARGFELVDSRVTGNGKRGVSASRAEPALYRNNHFSKNGGNGLDLFQSASRVEGNVATGNGGHGISIQDDPEIFFPYWVASNVADRNAGLGIFFRGLLVDPFSGRSVDGGGNAAKRNGDPRQCVEIQCAFSRGKADSSPPASAVVSRRGRR
jgi:hypothetical protein